MQRASVLSTNTSRRNVSANAGRPLWYPGNEAEIPEYLDGKLAGDYGFDPLGLGSSPEQLGTYAVFTASAVPITHIHIRTAKRSLER